ncbi:hypothetical protein PCH_Pc22g25100 [Penicillium rubens Wisconsin 54-1255]|uniref:Uncharacterized protein n=1 Tax=Penicillium rubens (strain ATCC 28089 / DSM 1075 / NRRL 1951 / Wisconsin 54-1255) TaxID=500485 RepID=B6HRP9_PENRW|nr:hypothetical protein PCH_Pc22g25100 [Penicillium rubens Wisconsin 54-1255]
MGFALVFVTLLHFHPFAVDWMAWCLPTRFRISVDHVAMWNECTPVSAIAAGPAALSDVSVTGVPRQGNPGEFVMLSPGRLGGGVEFPGAKFTDESAKHHLGYSYD